MFGRNIRRTNMLFEAIDKIRAYDRLYRMEQTDRVYLTIVESAQDELFAGIQQSCGEHAIISLATAFETYCNDMLQQLLSQFPEYFMSKHTPYSTRVKELIEDEAMANYELIQARLRLVNRFDFYAFFAAYGIEFLSPQEREFIEFIYLKRNNYVHNAGRIDTRTQKKLGEMAPPYREHLISTEAKRLRTKLGRMIHKLHIRIIGSIEPTHKA